MRSVLNSNNSLVIPSALEGMFSLTLNTLTPHSPSGVPAVSQTLAGLKTGSEVRLGKVEY